MQMRNVFLSFLLLFTLSATAQQADLGVQKSGPQHAPSDSDISYTVTVTNSGPAAATAVTLTDLVPAGTSFVSATQQTGPAFSCSAAITCTIATLNANTTSTFTFVFHADPATQVVDNTATIASTTTDPNSGNDSSSASTVAREADLAVEKTGPAEVPDNSDVTYTVTVTNTGPDDAESVTLSDPVPAGMSYVSATQDTGPTFACSSAVDCTIATLPAGATATFTFVFHIDEGTEFTNVATVSTKTADPNSENDTSTTFTTTGAPAQADLFVQKSGPAGAAPDTDVTFTITLGNAGSTAATNVVLTDNLPAPLTFVSFTQTSGPTMSCGTSTCTIASFPGGETATFELVGHVPAGTSAGTTITNTATVAADNDSFEENNSATTVVTVSTADVGIGKTAPSTAVAGTTITYELTVVNNGPDAAMNVVVLDPQVCDVVNCTLGTLTPGQTVIFTADVQIPPGATTSWPNTATVQTDSVDPNPNNDTATVSTTLTQSADVSVTKSGPATIVAATNITYTVDVTNNGPSNASDVVLTDTLPAETTLVSSSCGSTTCAIGTLAPGVTQSFTIVAHVDADATGPLVNTADVTTSTPDPSSSNNTSSVTTTVTPAPADVSISKSAPTAASVGTNVTYTIVVTNAGPATANNVVVTDTLPAGTMLVSSSAGCTGTTTITCTVGTLAANASATITLVVQMPQTPQTVTNTASVTTTSNDPTPGNDAASAQTGVAPAAVDLAIAKTTPFEAMLVGSNATYTIVLTNNGPETASDVVITDALPTGTTFVSSSAGCTGTTTVTCNVGTLTAGQTVTYTIVVTLPPTPQTVMNTATVSTSSNDPVPGNNSSTAVIVTQLQAVGIPTLSPAALGLLALTLASIVLAMLRRVS